MAVSFAVGVFIGISPLLGAHTLLGMGASYAFRLNMVATITGVYITNPWTMIPIYTFCTWIGTLMLGTELLLHEIDFGSLSFGTLMDELRHLLKPFLIGSFAVAAVSAVLFYALAFWLLKRMKKTHVPEA